MATEEVQACPLTLTLDPEQQYELCEAMAEAYATLNHGVTQADSWKLPDLRARVLHSMGVLERTRAQFNQPGLIPLNGRMSRNPLPAQS